MTLEEGEMIGTMRDWRKALRSPPAYRVVNRTLRSQTKFVTIIAVTGLVILLILYVFPKRTVSTELHLQDLYRSYNYSYPLSSPIITSNMHTFRIGIIADLDTSSLSSSEKNTWYSYLQKGYLSYRPDVGSVVVSWDKSGPVRLSSGYALRGRGMELSELVVFDGRLLACDDRTGLLYEVVMVGEKPRVQPWLLLMDGDGRSSNKGFKCEWATVRGETLWLGSMGKEWTTSAGAFQSHAPMWVKAVSHTGQVQHVSWVAAYERVRAALGIKWPGYMIHESAAWSPVHRRWFFLPRRCSHQRYNETLDEHMGCAVLISADEALYDVQVTQLPNQMATRGYSSFKFVPGTGDSVIVALRTEEVSGNTATYVTAFTVQGALLLPDTHVADLKYEGLEFI